jgi:WD repeat-containing protein 81
MLNLCYIGPDGFSPTVDKFQDQKIRISRSRVKGDVLAQNVLESLSGLVSLYGEQLILLQYLPYAWDLISICRQKRGGKLTPNLEGGLLGCLSLVHHMIPYLSSDSVLMNELSDGLLARVLFPVLQVATSRCLIFTGGWRPRNILIYKLLDVVYLLGLRIGEEMARLHLTPICKSPN